MIRLNYRADFIQILIIAAVAIAGYSNTFAVPFVFDDVRNIVENPAVKDIASLFDRSRIADLAQDSPTVYNTVRTRFVSYLSFALNYRLHGFSVAGYHLVNLSIHIFNGILVFALSRLLLTHPAFSNSSDNAPSAVDPARWLHLLPALLFVSHPLQTQAVTYIVQRMTSLATFFILLATVGYICSRRGKSPQTGRKWFVVALVSAILGMLTKEFVLVLPIILACWEYLLGAGSKKERFCCLAPFLLTPLIIPASLFGKQLVAFDFEEIRRIISISTSNPSLPAIDYLFTQLRVILTYIRLLIFPTRQNLDYDFHVLNTFWTWPVIASALLIMAVLLISACTIKISAKSEPESRKLQRLLIFFVWAFFLALTPESSIFPIADVIFEHRMYFPSIWFFLIVSIVMTYVIGKVPQSCRLIPLVGCILVIIALTAATRARNHVWQSEESIWRDVTSKSPGKARGHLNLAITLSKQGQQADALAEIKAALSIEPNSTNLLLTFSDVNRKLGHWDEAIQASQAALTISPKDTNALGSLGTLYLEKGDLDLAHFYLQRAQQAAPNNPRASYDLARLYTSQRRYELAEKAYLRAIDLSDTYYQARYNLGLLYLDQGKLPLSEQQFRAVIETTPSLVKAYNSLVVALKRQGRMDEARSWGRKALDLSPDDVTARRNWAELAREGLPK